MTKNHGWIGVDLDATLAYYDGWKGPEHIGEPIEPMVERVKEWLAAGRDVRIFTARISSDGSVQRNREALIAQRAIDVWCEQHIGQVLRVTNVKDYAMAELWDDRAVTVEQNTGRVLAESQGRFRTTQAEEKA